MNKLCQRSISIKFKFNFLGLPCEKQEGKNLQNKMCDVQLWSRDFSRVEKTTNMNI